jgi:cytochrome c-type biogenesis protein CcmF
MIAELGHYALVLALGIAVFQAVAPLIGAAQRNALMHAAVPAALVQFLAVATAFAALTHAYLISDFSVANVFENSHSAKPLLYKISGVWGNHEGSMVLWVLILAIFGGMVALFGGNLPETLKARVLAVQGAIGAAFLLFIVATSNPFTRLVPPPVEGNGLNPILQDPALAFHPPFLYMGYVGLSVAFSFAVAALIEGRVDPAWARWVRPWTLAAWMFLTVGIAMGSWWAYYELGWGGWWFWDPVENASFMPWLVATALLHSAIVVEKRNALKIWTVLLAIIAFSLSLLGTFLVRSGVLTSVHAFAVDPARGVFILGILCFFIGGALALFGWRAPQLQAGGLFTPISREGGLVMNNVLLCVAAAAVLTGTLYPLALESVTGEKISVGPPYFNLTFGPIILPLLLLVPLGPFLTWKRADARAVMQRVWIAAIIAIAAGAIATALAGGTSVLAVLGVALGVWMIAGSLFEFAEKIALFRTPFKTTLSRLFGLPAASIGMTLAHMGLGVMVIGIMSISTLKEEHIVAMKPGDAQQVGGYTVTFVAETPLTGPNFTGRAGRFTISKDGAETASVVSEKRQFRPRGMDTTEVGLHAMLAGDVYVVMGDATDDGGRVVRLYYNPWVSLIWLGAAVMFLGGGISLFDRRYRVGAPKPAPRAQTVPAE